MKTDILTRRFAAEQVKHRPGQHGKTISYIDVAAVIDRLNEAFDHRWDFEVVRHDVHEEEVVVLGRLTAENVMKMAFGSSAITADGQGRTVRPPAAIMEMEQTGRVLSLHAATGGVDSREV